MEPHARQDRISTHGHYTWGHTSRTNPCAPSPARIMCRLPRSHPDSLFQGSMQKRFYAPPGGSTRPRSPSVVLVLFGDQMVKGYAHWGASDGPPRNSTQWCAADLTPEAWSKQQPGVNGGLFRRLSPGPGMCPMSTNHARGQAGSSKVLSICTRP